MRRAASNSRAPPSPPAAGSTLVVPIPPPLRRRGDPWHARTMSPRPPPLAWAVACAILAACGGSAPTGGVSVTPPTGPDPGTGSSTCAVPAAGAAEDVSRPTSVVGTGRPETCTPEALEAALQRGGVITFDCGPDPVTITVPHEIRLLNDVGPGGLGDRVVDGGGKVTLSGGGRTRILYQD